MQQAMRMPTTAGVRCPECGRYLGTLTDGRAEYVCHGYTIAVSRRRP